MAATDLSRGILKNLSHNVSAALTTSGKVTHAANIPCFQAVVPAQRQWDLYSVRVVYDPTASGNAGARTLALEIQDENGFTVFESPVGVTTTNAAVRDYQWITGEARDTAFIGIAPQVAMSPLPHQTTLGAGMKINIYDESNVDSADKVSVDILGEEVSIA